MPLACGREVGGSVGPVEEPHEGLERAGHSGRELGRGDRGRPPVPGIRRAMEMGSLPAGAGLHCAADTCSHHQGPRGPSQASGREGPGVGGGGHRPIRVWVTVATVRGGGSAMSSGCRGKSRGGGGAQLGRECAWPILPISAPDSGRRMPQVTAESERAPRQPERGPASPWWRDSGPHGRGSEAQPC